LVFYIKRIISRIIEIEDLWAFNDEKVARTLAESPVPLLLSWQFQINLSCGLG